MGFEVSDVFVTLKPARALEAGEDPGGAGRGDGRGDRDAARACGPVYSQPIELRINEMVAGIRADLGDQALRRRPGGAARRRPPRSSGSSRTIPGAADVSTEQITGLPVLRVEVDRQAARPATASRPRQVLDVVEAVGRDRRRRGPRAGPPVPAGRPAARCRYRDDPQALETILIPTASGQRLPLTRLARLVETDRPLDDPARVGPAADRRPGERPRPRHRLVRRGGPGSGSAREVRAAGRLLDRVGRPVREPEPRRAAAAASSCRWPWP